MFFSSIEIFADDIDLVELINLSDTSENILIQSNDLEEGTNVVTSSAVEINFVDNKESVTLDIESEKINIEQNEELTIDLTIENITELSVADITNEEVTDVNSRGEFTLLDLGIYARHFGKNSDITELSKYKSDIVVNDEIDENDLLEMEKMIMKNTDYESNNN
jgi:hypothetical protein